MKLKKGFTLIELVVVVAVIGVLVAMIIVGLQNARAKARDAQRKGDLRSLKTAFETSYADALTVAKDGIDKPKSTYVIKTTAGLVSDMVWLSPSYIKTIPTDPLDKNPYLYLSDSKGKNYAVFAVLENSSDTEIVTTDPVAGVRPNGYNYWIEND